MTAVRKITVSTSIRFIDMAMESTDVALEVVRGVIAALGETCREEIKQALEDAGAKDVTINMIAY